MAGFGGGFKAGFGEDSYGAMLARLDQLPYAAPLDLKALLNSFPQSQVRHCTYNNMARKWIVVSKSKHARVRGQTEVEVIRTEGYHEIRPNRPSNPLLPSNTSASFIFPLMMAA